MEGKSSASFLITMTLLFGPGTAFLFPDLMRTGHVQSKYKIAVIEEEPFLYGNGTGYVPELLRIVADWYSATNENNDSFSYEIIPVNNYRQLMTKAETTHWQVSFGLYSSSSFKYEEPWKSMQMSSTLNIGLMLVTSSSSSSSASSKVISKTTAMMMMMTMTKIFSHRSSTNRRFHKTTTTALPWPSSLLEEEGEGEGRVFNTGNRIEAKEHRASILALEGSTEEFLLRKSPKYRKNVKTVENIDEALRYIRRHPNSFLLKNSATARRLEQQADLGLTTLCPKHSLTAGSHLYYGFFGRDRAIIQFLNMAFKKIKSSGNDVIKALNTKYFGHLRNCFK